MAALSAEQMQEMMTGIQNNLMKAMADIMNSNRASEKEAAATAAATAAETATKVAAKAAAAAAEHKSDKLRHEKPQKLDLKDFTKVEKFAGGEAAWKEWSFDFKTVVSAINPSMSRWFDKCETEKENLTTEKALAYAHAHGDEPKDIEARSKELFALLCMLNRGRSKANYPRTIRWTSRVPNDPQDILAYNNGENHQDDPRGTCTKKSGKHRRNHH